MCIIMAQGNMPKIGSFPRDCGMDKWVWRVYKMDVLDLRVYRMDVHENRVFDVVHNGFSLI